MPEIFDFYSFVVPTFLYSVTVQFEEISNYGSLQFYMISKALKLKESAKNGI